MFATLSGCSGGTASPSLPDAASAQIACDRVGHALCTQLYECYTADELMTMSLPASEADCETLENAQCAANPPEPGFCKGHPQTSAAMASACAGELTGMTCTQFRQPSSGVCKTELCAP